MLARMIPTKTHAGMDYAVGLLLIASPWLFGFADESTAATWLAVLAGVAMLGLSMVTDYEGGLLARLIPMRTHLMADTGLGLLLAARRGCSASPTRARTRGFPSSRSALARSPRP